MSKDTFEKKKEKHDPQGQWSMIRGNSEHFFEPILFSFVFYPGRQDNKVESKDARNQRVTFFFFVTVPHFTGEEL